MILSFEEFLAKARENEDKKVKAITIDIDKFGKISFQRPSINIMLEFQKKMLESLGGVEFDKQKQVSFDMAELDIEDFAHASSKFIYETCEFIRRKEIRDMYSKYEFYDIPLALFGDMEVINIATNVYNRFKGNEEIEKKVDEIKN